MRLNILNARNAVINGRSNYVDILEDAWQAHLVSKEPDAPTVISLFAGAGGSSLGYSMAGFRELLAVEWDNEATKTFKVNFPAVPVWQDDITELSVQQVGEMTELETDELDVLDGSPPCQGCSSAGKLLLNDSRNSLFQEYVRLLRGLRPKIFLMENVSGMVKGKMKLIFAEIMKELKRSDYGVSCQLMDVAYFNVPQHRRRLIWIGIREDLDVKLSHPKAQEKPLTIKDAVGDLSVEQDPEIGHIWIDERGKTKTYSLAKRARQGQKYRGHYYRFHWNKPSGTLLRPWLKPYLGNCGCHPLYTRTFSMREYARLFSFPDQFVFPDPWEAFNQMGNCVPPLFMREIARYIRETLLK